MSPLLQLDAVQAGFDGRMVLHGVDLVVEEGSAVGLFGLNGAGKSVMMKVVAGLVPARSGRLAFDGHDITRRQTEDRMRLGMAYVPQGRQLFPDLTVAENLRLGSVVLRRRHPEQARAALDEVYERFPRLAERRTQRAGSMSGGEQAMLAIARALAGAPRMLLIDEPSAGLAPAVIEEVFAMLQGLRAEGRTILLVEQNISLGFGLVERAVILQTGRVVCDEPVAGLSTHRVAELLGVGRLLGRQLEVAADRTAGRDPATATSSSKAAGTTSKRSRSTRARGARP